MADDRAPKEAVKGIVEEAKGKAKEAAGTLIGNEELKREGQAEQHNPSYIPRCARAGGAVDR